METGPVKKKHLLIPVGTPRRPSVFARALTFILRPILMPVFFVIGAMYKLCFGWLDKKVARKYDEEFARDIRANLPLLFEERHARILSNEGKQFRRGFDAAYVVLEVDTLLFKFCRCRGDFSVTVASELAPEDSENLDLVLETILCPPESRQAIHESCALLRTLPRVLYPHFETLKAALSQQQYSSTLRKTVAAHNERVDLQAAELRAQGINPKVI